GVVVVAEAQPAGVAHGDRAVVGVGVGVPVHLLRVAVVDHRVGGDEAANRGVVLPGPQVGGPGGLPPTKPFSLGQLGTLPRGLPKGVCQRSIAVWSPAAIASMEVPCWSGISQLTPAAVRIATSRPAWV